MSSERRRLTSPVELRALSHPTRLTLLELLDSEGPLTATQAGELIGESPASCSFHLRTLAAGAFLELLRERDAERLRRWAVTRADDTELAAANGALQTLAAMSRLLSPIAGMSTTLQRLTPMYLQGRVFSAVDVLISTPQSLSIALGAVLISTVDHRVLLGVMSTGMLLAALYLGTRREQRLAAPAPPPGDEAAPAATNPAATDPAPTNPAAADAAAAGTDGGPVRTDGAPAPTGRQPEPATARGAV